MVRYKSLRDGSTLELEAENERLEASGKWERLPDEKPADRSGTDKEKGSDR